MTGLNWAILLSFLGGLLAWVAWSARGDRSVDAEASFFKGTDPAGRELRGMALTATLLISWIFAKSVQNAADLGQAFGLPGGVAYAAYWLSFLVAGWVILRLRERGFRSIHQFLASRYGTAAVWFFSLVLLFRLWNEVWSNTMVVAQFFGPTGSPSFLAASWATTLLVLGYSLLSGFRGSILTDLLQMALASVVLLLILAVVLPRADLGAMAGSGSWTLEGGVDLLLVALLQSFSYPFHDPVMTDRGFLTDPRTTFRGFLAAGILGVLFITLFSLLGVYNGLAGIGGNSTFGTAAVLGLPALLLVNVMMLTSASSTLDSTFASVGKLAAVDLTDPGPGNRVRMARWTMVVLALLGGAMVHASPTILSATTVSGTMVIGLTPVFTLWWWERPGRASYLASLLVGLAFGLCLALGWIPGAIGGGPYGNLLLVNVLGIVACYAVFVALAWTAPRDGDGDDDSARRPPLSPGAGLPGAGEADPGGRAPHRRTSVSGRKAAQANQR